MLHNVCMLCNDAWKLMQSKIEKNLNNLKKWKSINQSINQSISCIAEIEHLIYIYIKKDLPY